MAEHERYRDRRSRGPRRTDEDERMRKPGPGDDWRQEEDQRSRQFRGYEEYGRGVAPRRDDEPADRRVGFGRHRRDDERDNAPDRTPGRDAGPYDDPYLYEPRRRAGPGFGYEGRSPDREAEYGQGPGGRGHAAQRHDDEAWYGQYQSGRGAGFRGKGPKNYNRSDERIREDVCDRLCDDAEIDASDVEVVVSDREVTLNGTARSREQRRWAEACAEDVAAVTHVQNNLRVKPEGGTSQQGA